jgi:hypothetical protein
MSGISIDGTAEPESNASISLPGTPADDDASVWEGELVHDFLVFGWLISATSQTRIRSLHQSTVQKLLSILL